MYAPRWMDSPLRAVHARLACHWGPAASAAGPASVRAKAKESNLGWSEVLDRSYNRRMLLASQAGHRRGPWGASPLSMYRSKLGHGV